MTNERLFQVELEPGWRLRSLTEDRRGVAFKVTEDPAAMLWADEALARAYVAALAKIGRAAKVVA